MADNKIFPHFHEAYFPWIKSGMNEKKLYMAEDDNNYE